MLQDIEELQNKIDKLNQRIDVHDCHLSPYDSCNCVQWVKELKQLEDIIFNNLKNHDAKNNMR